MRKFTGWRKLLTFATVDALLVVTATSAWAASAAPAPAASPAVPVLLLLGVGLVVAPWRRDGHRQDDLITNG